jgi:hypothetical protein
VVCALRLRRVAPSLAPKPPGKWVPFAGRRARFWFTTDGHSWRLAAHGRSPTEAVGQRPAGHIEEVVASPDFLRTRLAQGAGRACRLIRLQDAVADFGAICLWLEALGLRPGTCTRALGAVSEVVSEVASGAQPEIGSRVISGFDSDVTSRLASGVGCPVTTG